MPILDDCLDVISRQPQLSVVGVVYSDRAILVARQPGAVGAKPQISQAILAHSPHICRESDLVREPQLLKPAVLQPAHAADPADPQSPFAILHQGSDLISRQRALTPKLVEFSVRIFEEASSPG